MLDVLDHFTDILIGLAIFFIVPLIYIGLKQEALIRTVVSEQTSELVDQVRSNGYLTSDMYDGFLSSLSNTGLLYDIKLEHKQKTIEPEYRFRTIDEILEEKNKAYTGTNEYHYYPVSTSIPVVIDPIDNSGLTMNTETNESVLASTPSTPSIGHVHTDDCYFGHVHKGSAGPFMIPHAHTSSCGKYTAALGYAMHCNNCGKNYPGWYSWYNRLPSGALEWTGSDLYGYKICPYCNSNYVSQGSEIHNYAHTCGYDIDTNNDRYYDDTPIGVVVNYPSSYPPESVGKATYTNGCYTYHVHRTTQMEYNSLTSISSVPQTATYYKLFQNGLNNYCDVPRYFYLGIDSLNYKYPGFGVRYRTEYNASDHSFTFYYEAYKNSQYGSYINSNPGFPSVLTEAQFYSTYYSKYEFVNLWNRIGTLGLLSTTSSDFCVNYSMTDLIDLCEYTTFNSWYLACGKEGNGYLACNQKVTSITPTHPTQAVFTGENLITTARATYADGSTRVILCSTTFRTDAVTQNADVVLTYTDALGNVLTTHINVTVVPRTKTCHKGHVYNLNTDGSDPGCIYCRSWLASLTIDFPTTPSFSIYRGTTLAENGVTLLATYLDGHTELLESEYIDNLDKYYVGSQNVTLSYKGHYVYLTVVTKRNLTTCPVCHRQYELYPDDSDGGCPWCAARTPIFTGNVMESYNMKYKNEILELFNNGKKIYRFSDDDYFTISVKSRQGSFGSRILSAIYNSGDLNCIHVIKSGYIREDGFNYQ